MGTIYKLNFSSGKSYIGMTTKSFQCRFIEHKKISKRGKFNLYKAWRKYGQPTFEILAELPNDQLPSAEIEAIKTHNTLTPHGYNMTTGGEISPMNIPEIAKRFSDKMKGRIFSEETKKKFSIAKLGNKNLLGYIPSIETRKKISDANKGRKRTPEQILRITTGRKVAGSKI